MADPRLAPGARAGGFEIVEFLARGGMGEVYAARELATGARAALKVLPDASGAEGARFEREGRIAARLDHPNIVRGLGHGRTPEGLAWLAMELLEGTDLEARLAAGPIEPAAVVALAAQVCDALAYAHARGVVHRDLKPSNIFLCAGPTARVKVLDFGIARVASERQLTRTGVPIGTPAYMSPEQARGEREVDPRTDLWSLGVVVYECLAGRKPFEAESLIGALYKIVEAAPRDLAELRPDLPAALVGAVRRAMARRPPDRPASAAALREMLSDCGEPGDVPGPPPAGPSEARADLSDTAALEPERRLVTAVVLRDARDPGLVRRVAAELGGRLEALATGGHLVLFGVERWSGDEPARGVRLATAVASTVRGAGVVTGRVLRSASRVTGDAVDAAALLAGREGVHVDADTLPFAGPGLRADAAPDGTARLDAPGASPPSYAPAAGSATALLGREAELGVLVESAAVAGREQRVRVVLVLGGAGIGKSRLRHEAAALLAAREPGATGLAARCDRHRHAAPFAALRDALSPGVGPAAAPPAAPPDVDPQAEVDRVRASLESLIAGLAERGPVVLSLDDAQWLDAPSRSALRWLCENAPYLPLALWLFARPEARESLREVAPDCAVIELAPLSRAHAEGLLREVAGDAPEALVERAGGNPLFLEELGRLYARRGAADAAALPVSVEGAHLTQLDAIGPADREFLKRAAVYGRSAWVEGVGALGGAPEAMPRLVRGGVVVPRPRSRFEGTREFAFRAGTLQEVAYGLLPDALRADLHGRAARWLGGRPGVSPAEAAGHWDLAGDRDRAAGAYADAAADAARVADAAGACAHAARALALTDDPALRWRVLVARDGALQLGGDLGLRRAGLAELSALAESLGLRHRVEAAWRRCYFARTTSDREGAAENGRLALALARQLGDPRWSTAVNIELAMLYAGAARFDEARAHARSAAESCALLDDGWLAARVAATRAYVAGEAGELARSLDLFEAAADGFARADDRRREAGARANAGFAMMELGRVEEAERQIAASIEVAQRVGSLVTVAASTHNLGVLRRALGDLPAAEALQARAGALSARLGLARVASEVATERVYLALEGAQADEVCVGLADEAEDLADDARAPTLLAAALAAGLRARARAGACGEDELAAARAHAASSHGRARAALLVALYEAGGRRPEDAAPARAAIAAYVTRPDAPEDGAAMRAAFARRYAVPDELLG